MFNKTKAQEVYVITYLPTGKKYVGKSIDVKARFEKHFYDLARRRHPSKGLQKDYDTYGGGMDAFKVEIAGEQRPLYSAKDDLERSTMIKLRTYDERYGYNDHDQAMQRVRIENGLPLSHAGIIKTRNRTRKFTKKKKYHSIGTVSAKSGGKVVNLSLGRITMMVARTIADLTQAELAEKMGVSRDAVAKWETNRTGISSKNLQRFCEITGFQADEIILPVNSKKTGENA